ncbi:MAG: serine hydrolase domain-containing protein, partial [Bacteroidota bacterium]
VRLVNQEAAPAVNRPGTAFAYSNTNYVLLAGIIEATSGKSFEAFLREELFTPLEMPNTRVWNLVSGEKTFPNKTGGFGRFAGRIKVLKPDFLDGVAGDGAVFSSIEDFLIWDRFWTGNELISDDLLQQAFVPGQLQGNETSKYGFGWALEEGYHWHNGSWLGAMTHIARNPERGTLLVILDNSQNIRLGDIAREVESVWRQL